MNLAPFNATAFDGVIFPVIVTGPAPTRLPDPRRGTSTRLGPDPRQGTSARIGPDPRQGTSTRL